MLNELSVVIPTIGEKSLLETIKKLNYKKNQIPSEIIISIYYLNFYKIQNKLNNYTNIKIIKVNKKGQVNQRVQGFINAKKKYVLQLDADCIISVKDILLLLNNLRKDKRNKAVAPILYDEKSTKPIYIYKDNFLNNFKNFILGFKNGLNKMGTVSKSGTNMGVDPNFTNLNSLPVEWLAGGCIMHKKNNLIKKNFYHFLFKAYCEDLIHSFYLKKKKIDLEIVTKARCYTSFPIFPKIKKDLNNFLQAYTYFANLKKVNTVRIKMVKLIYLTRFILNNLLVYLNIKFK